MTRLSDLAAQGWLPTCAKCGAAVREVRSWYAPDEEVLRYDVFCHGDREAYELPYWSLTEEATIVGLATVFNAPPPHQGTPACLPPPASSVC